jgi:DNA helicase IV
LGYLGKADAHVEQLTKGFRVPGEVIEYAARLLPAIAPDLEPPTSVRRTRGELTVTRVTDLVAATVAAARVGVEQIGSVGLILPDALVPAVTAALTSGGVGHAVLGADSEFDIKLDVVPTSLAKGLEFDHVILLEPAGVVAGEADQVTGLRRLYVCLTRAVTSLVVLHTEDLPTQLARVGMMGG